MMNAKTDLLLQIDPFQGTCVADNNECHKVIITYQLYRREYRQRIDEQLAFMFELPHRNEMQATVDFETNTAVPVTALFYESAKG